MTARQLLPLLLVLQCLLAGCTPRQATLPLPSPLPPVRAGNRLLWEGRESFWIGANYAWYNYGTDFGTGKWGKRTDWRQIDTDFGRMQRAGVRLVRWHVFADGRYSPDWNSDGSVKGLDATFLKDIDRALEIAERHRLRLLFVLVDSLIWTSPSVVDGVTLAGHGDMLTLARTQDSFMDNALLPLLKHVAASPRRKWVLGYDIVNEPEYQMKGYLAGRFSKSVVRAFVRRCVDYIHRYGRGAYATVGAATPEWVYTWKGLDLDFYQIHYYPGMDLRPMPGEPPSPGNGLPEYASLKLDRPCIVGEFATKSAARGYTDKRPHGPRWHLDTIHKRGYAGALAWSFRAGDAPSDWRSFAPVLTRWRKTRDYSLGP